MARAFGILLIIGGLILAVPCIIMALMTPFSSSMPFWQVAGVGVFAMVCGFVLQPRQRLP